VRPSRLARAHHSMRGGCLTRNLPPQQHAPCTIAQCVSHALARCHDPLPFQLLSNQLERPVGLPPPASQRPASGSRTTSDASGGRRGGTVAWPARGPSQPPR
jgi:hypothetical protein